MSNQVYRSRVRESLKYDSRMIDAFNRRVSAESRADAPVAGRLQPKSSGFVAGSGCGSLTCDESLFLMRASLFPLTWLLLTSIETLYSRAVSNGIWISL